MSYPKDSAIFIIVEAEQGYMSHALSWNTSPPDIWGKLMSLLAATTITPPDDFEGKYIAADKTTLKNHFGTFVDNEFAQD